MRYGGRSNRRYRNLTFALILVGLLGSLTVGLLALRQNNLRMRELRTAVFEADQQNKSDEELEKALQALRQHVLTHMNANLKPVNTDSGAPPIQLPYKYYRDTVELWSREIRTIDTGLLGYLSQARQFCETENFVISERLNCLVDRTSEVDGMPQARDFAPPIELYVFDFVSPQWTPDLAGISLVVFFLFLGVLVLRLLF